MNPPNATSADNTASRLIDDKIASLTDWRGSTLAHIRSLILAAHPGIVEEWKWRGTPVWSHSGILCTGETYQKVVKLTFAHGASLPDPTHLFNSSLTGNTRRAIDIPQGHQLDPLAFQTLIRAAIAFNTGKQSRTKTNRSMSPGPNLGPKSNPTKAK